MKRAVIRRYKNVVDVTRDGKEPLTLSEYQLLMPRMSYHKVTQLFGKNIREDKDTGEKIKVEVEPQRLYRFDGRGRLICGAGFTDMIARTFRDAGYAVDVVDVSPPRKPGVLEPNWKRLRRYKEFRLVPGEREKLAAILARDGRIDPGDTENVSLARRVVQRDILKAVLARMERGLPGIVQVPPGVGKSFSFASYLILFDKARIDFVVPDIDNSRKTWRHLTKYAPGVGLVGGGSKSFGRCNVMVGHSLHLAKGDADIMAVDEGHAFMGDALSEKLAVASAGAHAQHPGPVMITFTATPKGRRDGTDARMQGLFGPVIYKMTWPEAVRLGLVVPIEFEVLPVDVPNPIDDLNDWQKDSLVWRKRVGLWRNEGRNSIIAKRVRMVPEGEQVLIMVESIEHAIHLRKLLPDFELCYGTHDVDRFAAYRKKGLIEGDFAPMTDHRREDLRLAFEDASLRRVIATDVWSTGVSFDRLAVLLRADARSSTIKDEQIPGRVSRTHPDKPAGLVIDCDDSFDQGFSRAFQSRKRNYRSKGWREVPSPLRRRQRLTGR